MSNNFEMLQKLSSGKNHVEEIDINGVKLNIRPLSDGELTKLQVIEKKPYTMNMKLNSKGKRGETNTNTQDMDVGMGEFTQSQSEAMYTAVAWSLSIDDDTFTADDVRNLDKGVPELIFKEVVRISKLNESDLSAIKNFRKF